MRLGLAWTELSRGWGFLVPERRELLQVAVPAEDPWYGFPDKARLAPGAGVHEVQEVPFEDLPPGVQEALRTGNFDHPQLRSPGLAEHVRRAQNARREEEARSGPQASGDSLRGPPEAGRWGTAPGRCCCSTGLGDSPSRSYAAAD